MKMDEGLIYFRDGEVVAEHGEATVYKLNSELFLEIGGGHTLWTLESEIEDYKQQLYDWPNGDCLEIGLGLGVASRYLLTFPKVKSLTTVEKHPDVAAVHSKINEKDRGLRFNYSRNKHKHSIFNTDGLSYLYQTSKRFDFIFMDFYDRIDEDTLPTISDMARACKRVLSPEGRLVGWLDPHSPEPYYSAFMRVIEDANKF